MEERLAASEAVAHSSTVQLLGLWWYRTPWSSNQAEKAGMKHREMALHVSISP